MAKRTKKKPDLWAELQQFIANYVDAAIADSWKGGGDPADCEVIEARFKLAHLELQAHIEKMHREYTT